MDGWMDGEERRGKESVYREGLQFPAPVRVHHLMAIFNICFVTCQHLSGH